MKIRVLLALAVTVAWAQAVSHQLRASDLNGALMAVSGSTQEATVLPMGNPQEVPPAAATTLPDSNMTLADAPLPAAQGKETTATAGTAAAAAPALATTAGANTAEAAGGDSAEPKPWHLPQPRVFQSLGIETYGWLEQGMVFNNLSPQNRWNGPVACADRSNEYEMNQLWLGFERKVNTQGCGFDVGGRIDLLYGSDWRYGDSYGLESKIDNQNKLYGFDLPQFYLSAGYNDLTVRMGHYAPSIGYEVVAAPGNFFYTHSYALAYSEPVLVTGLEADYKLSDNWNVLAGFHRGWGMFDDNNDKLDFLGGAKWHNDETKTSLSFMIDVGAQDPAGVNQQFDYALVFKQQLTEKLLYAFEHVLGGTENADPRTGGYATWYGLDQYLVYTIDPHWSLGSRVEFFRDQDGSRVAGVGNLNDGWMGAPGFAGTFTEATFGLNWRPHPNFVLRPELRWDWYDGSTNIQGQLPFGDGQRSQQFLFATDLIMTF